MFVDFVLVLQIQANVRVLTQERDSVNALYSEVNVSKLTLEVMYIE